jgi:hypothetical protein
LYWTSLSGSSVGETLRDEQLVPFRGRQADAGPLPVSRRAGADIDRDIEYGAARDAHELVLGERRRLEMQATQDSDFARQGMIVLDEVEIDPNRREGSLTPGFREEAALVGQLAGAELHDTVQGQRADLKQG